MSDYAQGYVDLCLPIFGLAHYKVTVIWEEDEGPGCYADISQNDEAPEARLRLYPAFENQPDADKPQTIAHELWHLKWDVLDLVQLAFKDEIPDRLWAPCWKLIRNREEFQIDAAARIVAPLLPPWSDPGDE